MTASRRRACACSDLDPCGAVPLPRVVAATRAVVTAEKHDSPTDAVVDHRMTGARRGTCGRCPIDPVCAVPLPRVPAKRETVEILTPEQDDSLTRAVVGHG